MSSVSEWPYALAKSDSRHGTANGYKNLRCRCSRCQRAWADYYNAWRHKKGYSVPMEDHLYRIGLIADMRDNHGTETRYDRGCRCAQCREAMRLARLERRAAAKVLCSHGCGTLVDPYNARYLGKPPECRPCFQKRQAFERRAAA